MWLRAFHFGQLACFTCPFCLFFVPSSGTLEREDKSSGVGEASSALLAVGSVSDEHSRCLLCLSVLLQPVPRAGCSHSKLSGKDKQAGPSSAGHSWAAPELLKAWLYLPVQWLYPGVKRLRESLRGRSQLFCSQEITFALCTLFDSWIAGRISHGGFSVSVTFGCSSSSLRQL